MPTWSGERTRGSPKEVQGVGRVGAGWRAGSTAQGRASVAMDSAFPCFCIYIYMYTSRDLKARETRVTPIKVIKADSSSGTVGGNSPPDADGNETVCHP